MSWVGRFFLLVVAVGFIEVFLLVKVAAGVGFLGTVGLCILTGIIGGALVRHQGLQTLREIQRALSQGELPASEIVAGVVLLITGALLVMPGFLTDVLGFLALIPAARRRLADWLAHRLEGKLSFQGLPGAPGANPPGRVRGRVIDIKPDQ